MKLELIDPMMSGDDEIVADLYVDGEYSHSVAIELMHENHVDDDVRRIGQKLRTLPGIADQDDDQDDQEEA